MSETLSKKLHKAVSVTLLGALGVGVVTNPDSELSRFLTFQTSEAGAAGQSEPAHRVEVNEIGRRMLEDVQPYSPVDPDWAMAEAARRGSGLLLGEQINVADAMRYNYAAGFRGRDLIIKTALDGKESKHHPGAVGDVNWNIEGDRSIGTAQIYCQPNGDIGCEGVRNWRDNFDPLTNAQNSYALYAQAWEWYGQGSGELGINGRFKPWESAPDTARQYLPQAEEAYQQLNTLYGDLGN